MNVCIAALSRFHLFNMIEQLIRHHKFKLLVTAYPRFQLKKKWPALVSVSKSHVRFAVMRALILFLNRKGFNELANKLQEYNHISFSKSSTNYIGKEHCVFIGLSSYMVEAIQYSKQINSDTRMIVDHGSLHIALEREVLSKECKKYGFQKFGNWQHKWMIDRMDLEFKTADYVFCCSELARDSMLCRGVPKDKIFVNPLGVDLKKFKFKRCTSKETFRYLHVSNMSPLKGLHYIIEAFNLMDEHDMELWLVGPTPTEPLLQKLIKSNDKIKHLGFMDQGSLAMIYAQCDIFVHPSLADGWAMTPMQAMATGLPVIVSNMTGCKEIIVNNKNGFVVNSGEVESLLEVMNYVYQNQSILDEVGLKAYQTVREGFTWDDYGNRLNAWLEKLSNENSR